MVRSTKRCLRKMDGKAKFSYDEMHTAIVEIEAIVNSHPLTFLNSDDTEEPLTPPHLLMGHRILSLYLTTLHILHPKMKTLESLSTYYRGELNTSIVYSTTSGSGGAKDIS